MVNRTYRYFKGKPLYSFGYGLSYTSFLYSNFKVNPNYKTGDSVNLSVDIKNTGKVTGDEVVQLYLSNITAKVPVPIYSLKGFKRINLLPGEVKTVHFTIPPEAFSLIDEQNKKVIVPGDFEISIGGNLPTDKNAKNKTIQAKISLL
jgi:beta-glucosidase